MNKLNIELTESTRKGIYVWRVRHSGDRFGSDFLAVGTCDSPEESERIAKLVRDACEPIFSSAAPQAIQEGNK